jgi:hypothetical protein
MPPFFASDTRIDCVRHIRNFFRVRDPLQMNQQHLTDISSKK